MSGERDTAALILDRLDRMGAAYDLLEHPPAETFDDCVPIGQALDALVLKNLFLTTRRAGGFYLYVTRPETPFAAGPVSRQAGTSRLCLAPEEDLTRLLRARRGAANPLALMFDAEGDVRLLLDGALRGVRRLAFHPCRNDMTVAMAIGTFTDTFLPRIGHEPTWIEPDA